VNERSLLYVGIALVVLALFATTAIVPGRGGSGEASSPSTPVSGNLSARVPAGQVATAIRLSRVESAGGAIRSGDLIDLYSYFPERSTDAGPFTRVLLSDKQVYAAVPDNDSESVTLVVSPDEAILLQNALQIGARPFAVIRSGRGGPPAAAPASISDENLATWITQVGSGR
jgi:hypothetical protein